MSSHLSTIAAVAAVVAAVSAGATVPPSFHPSHQLRYEASASRPVSADSDSIVVTVNNSMSHDWEIFLEKSGGARTSLGKVDGGASQPISVPRVAADSVTMIAVSIMGAVTRRFPTHATQALSWDL